jgi:F-type H+-transporting ATPase subunit alpha
VSRVGGAAQTNWIKGLSGGIRTDLAQYRELAAFAQFASDLDEATRKQLDRGGRVTELLKQPQYSPLPISLMGASLFAVNKGYMDSLEVKQVLPFESGLHAHLKDKHAALLDAIEKNGAKWDNKPAKDSDSADKKAFKKLCIDAEAELAAAIEAFKKVFA